MLYLLLQNVRAMVDQRGFCDCECIMKQLSSHIYSEDSTAEYYSFCTAVSNIQQPTCALSKLSCTEIRHILLWLHL